MADLLLAPNATKWASSSWSLCAIRSSVQSHQHSSIWGARFSLKACVSKGRRNLVNGIVVGRQTDGIRCQVSATRPESIVEQQKADDVYSSLSQVCAVLGSQWGDEGKGKLVDILARRYDVVARCQGGANAGHTIYNDEGKKFALHVVPSGILNDNAVCVVGNGVVVHVPGFFDEIKKLEEAGIVCEGRLFVSDRAHILFDLHRTVDALREAELAGAMIGTTKRGIGPCYASKAIRNGIRFGDLRHLDTFKDKLEVLLKDAASRFPDFTYDLDGEMERYTLYAERLVPYITDTVHFINEAHRQKKRILVEGGQATMLDIDFGTYPFVTSSNPSAGGICTGLGIAPNRLGDIVGVAKAYTTRVGAGPYPTELFGELGEQLRAAGHEYGTTTGRPRRCGWLDLVALKYTCDINGFTSINLTKLDVFSGFGKLKLGVGYKTKNGEKLQYFPSDLSLLESVEVEYEEMPGWTEDISLVRQYEDLPAAARGYVERIEHHIGLPIRFIGVGPGREALIVR